MPAKKYAKKTRRALRTWRAICDSYNVAYRDALNASALLEKDVEEGTPCTTLDVVRWGLIYADGKEDEDERRAPTLPRLHEFRQ